MEQTSEIIPRFVRDLNTIGEQLGFTVTVKFAPVLDEEYLCQGIVSTWRGPRSAFGSLPDFVRRGVTKAEHRIVWPDGTDASHPVIYGILTRLDDNAVEIQMSGGEVPRSIKQNSDVEIIEYLSKTAYHGRFNKLFSLGYAIPDQFPEKGEFRRSNEDDIDNGRWAAAQWSTTRCFDPSKDPYYIHRVETQHARECRVCGIALTDDPDELRDIWEGLAKQDQSAQTGKPGQDVRSA